MAKKDTAPEAPQEAAPAGTIPDVPDVPVYAVFGLNNQFTLGLWRIPALPEPVEGDPPWEAVLRPATPDDLAMARGLIRDV